MYQALYRKWRPRSFDEVIGQQHITDTLKNEVASGRLSHAYLFTGSRGTGKTSCAKILSRAVNCLHPQNGNPCNECASCLGIENGSILDVIEMDAASNNGVDHVRALREEAVYTPGSVYRRVYIIDEVHMLSTPAFNALLKIMEEPPEHLLFILATTEVHKIPATILSRCQRFSFKRVIPEAITEHLISVAASEGIGLADDAAGQLSRLSDGSVRDALSLLDQCAAGSEYIDSERVESLLGLAGSRRIDELLSHIAARDGAGALALVSELYAAGKDVSSLLGELATRFRDLLVTRAAPQNGLPLLGSSGGAAEVQRLADVFSVSRIVFSLDLIGSTQQRLQQSRSRRVDAELCIVMLCDESLSLEPAALVARIEQLEAGAAFVPASPARNQENGPGPAAGMQREKAEPTDDMTAAEPPQAPSEHVPSAPAAAGSLLWPDILAKLKRQLAPPELACLLNSELVTVKTEGGTLFIQYRDEVTGRTINKQHVRDAVAAAAGSGINVAIVSAAAEANTADPFMDLIKLGSEHKNIELK